MRGSGAATEMPPSAHRRNASESTRELIYFACKSFAASVSTDLHQCGAVGYHYGCSMEHNQMPALELA